jgi:hypothetical protein
MYDPLFSHMCKVSFYNVICVHEEQNEEDGNVAIWEF